MPRWEYDESGTDPELADINENSIPDQYDNNPEGKDETDINTMNKSEIIWSISEQIEDSRPSQGPPIESEPNTRWNGDNMDIRADCTGARIGTLNTQRKLFASEVHWEMVKELMDKLDIDILVITEPGKADEMREASLKNWAISNGMAAEVAPRSRTSLAGGLVFIINTSWTGIKRTMTKFDTKIGDKDRVCSIEFDNMVEGEHNKLLLIGYYGYNASYRPVERELVLEMHKWIWDRKAEFRRRNPRAPVILAGDTNAATRTAIDTDTEAGIEEMEADSGTIQHLEDMGFLDPLRERYQTTVILTRRRKMVGERYETRRYLDRIMATSEVALNEGTRSGVLQDSIFGVGDTDHMMVITDVPVDVAGIAITRASLWDVHKTTRSIWDADEMGRMSQEKITEFNERARELDDVNIPTTATEIMKWLFEAGEGKVIQTQEREYPRRVRRLKDFQRKDWLMRRNAKVLRKIQWMIEAGSGIEKSLRRGRKLKDVEDSPHSGIKAEYRYQTNESRGTITDKLIRTLEGTTEYLMRESRLERAKQIKINIERRNKRFEDKGKKKMRDVITSIMRRARINEQITTQVRTENRGIATGAEEVAREVKKFYQEWMGSRVKCEDRWVSKESMMHMRLDELRDQSHRKFVEEAYMESYTTYNKKQDEEGIWDVVMKEITMEELKEALKRFKSGKAPGPSGLMFELLKALDDMNLRPILTLMRQCLSDRALPKELNKSMIRALPKTDQGLAEMCMTRPIALMESLGKLFERILFNRIVKVLAENDMIDLSQHGGMSRRGTTEPIRILAEVMEDAQASGQEFHLFSADLSKAFDTLEYWSQAMSWRALGMPVEITDMLTNLDEGGESEVILGQGRTTSAVLGEEGWFKSGRGVRQGSIGGPIKWIVYMNFWLKYVNGKHAGEGYRMSKDEDAVLLAQMYVDDSNWAARSVESLSSLVESGSNFVTFHGIAFNKKKSEYIAMNQDMSGDQWARPTWPDGTELIETIRVTGKYEDWRANLETERTEKSDRSLRKAMTGIPEEAVRSMTKEKWEEVQLELDGVAKKWREEAENNWWKGEPLPGLDEVTESVKKCRGKSTWAPEEEVRWTEEAESIVNTWSENEADRMRVIVKKGNAMRYLGVWFEEGSKWSKQRELLARKFEDLNERMGRSSPTREQATYCINATINTALKFPLQIANITRTDLKAWDRSNRSIVRKAGHLPTATPVDLMHLPRKEGGLGLENITEATGRLQIEQYMHLLNGPSASLAARITRAGRKRFLETGMPKLSVHARVMSELEDRGMQIIEASSWKLGKREDHFYWFGEQKNIDTAEVLENEATGGNWQAYGDGATFPREGRSGWGMWMTDGVEERGGCGRVQGKQSNDGAEATGILKALLRVNPKDDLDIYCDNTGCISKWQRVNEPGHPTEKWGYRAIWNRIGMLKTLRHEHGAQTNIRWVHSHVEEEGRKDSSKSKYKCACLVPGQAECNPIHPHHMGNERADTLAKEGAWEEGGEDYDEAARGEMWFVLKGEAGFAQGAAKEFLRDHDDGTHQGKNEDDGEGDGDEESTNWQRANSKMDREVMKMILKKLDRKSTTTWRFWARTLSGILPTHARMMKFANTGGEEGKYAKVYQGHIGEKGKCVSCECPEETNVHALWECPATQRIWDIAKSEIKLNWEEAGVAWERADWLENNIRGDWDLRWSMAGMVPKDTVKDLIEGQGMEHIEALTLVRDTALTILLAAHEAWTWRVKATEEWAKTNEYFLACRKAMKATGWRQDSKVKRKVRGESDAMKAKRLKIEAMQRVKTNAEEVERERQDEENMKRHREGKVPVSLKIRKESIKRAGDSAQKTEREEQKRRTLFKLWAGGTRRLELETVKEAWGKQTTQRHSWSRHEDQKGMWFPLPGTKVWMRSRKHEQDEIEEGIARALRWETGGTPEVQVDCSGNIKWFSIPKDAGTKIISIGGVSEMNSMGAKALDLIGHGSEVIVEWEGSKLKTWYEGKVVARCSGEITVRYGTASNASVAKHTYEDIENRGFVIKSARRIGEYTNETYRASNHGYGKDCILLTDEGKCECEACERAWIEDTGMIEDEEGKVGGWAKLGVREGRIRLEERREKMKASTKAREAAERKKRKTNAHKLDQQMTEINAMTVPSEAFAAEKHGTVNTRILRSATRQNCPRDGEGDENHHRNEEGEETTSRNGEGNAKRSEIGCADGGRDGNGTNAEKGDGGQEDDGHDKGGPEAPLEAHDKEQSRGEGDWNGEGSEDMGVVLRHAEREEGDHETDDRVDEHLAVSAREQDQPTESGRGMGEDGSGQSHGEIHGKQRGGDGGGDVLDGEERGTSQGRNKDAEGREKGGTQDGKNKRLQKDGRSRSDVRSHRSTDIGRENGDGNGQRDEREESKRRRMAQRLPPMGEGIGMDTTIRRHGGHNCGSEVEAETDEREIHTKGGYGRPQDLRRRGGMGINRNRSVRDPRVRDNRSRQSRVPGPRREIWENNEQGTPGPVLRWEEKCPQEGSKDGVKDAGVVSDGVDVTRVQNSDGSKCDECEERMCQREPGRGPEELRDASGSEREEAGGTEAVQRINIQPDISIKGGDRPDMVCNGKPNKESPVGDGGGEIGCYRQGLENSGSGPMCIRTEVQEANKNNDEHPVGTRRIHRRGEVCNWQMWRNETKQARTRPKETRTTDDHKRPCQETKGRGPGRDEREKGIQRESREEPGPRGARQGDSDRGDGGREARREKKERRGEKRKPGVGEFTKKKKRKVNTEDDDNMTNNNETSNNKRKTPEDDLPSPKTGLRKDPETGQESPEMGIRLDPETDRKSSGMGIDRPAESPRAKRKTGDG